MAFPDESKGDDNPSSEPAPHVSYEPGTEKTYPYYDESYSHDNDWSHSGQPGNPVPLTPTAEASTAPLLEASSAPAGGGSQRPPDPPEPPEEEEDDDGMVRMSFLGHLEELRKRLLLAMAGVGVAFILSLLFSDQLWNFVAAPAVDALTRLGVKPPTLHQISPMDTFQIIWMKLPILSAIFVGSPWILYQVWAFIAPGLYKKERRWAAPFVVSTAGLFVTGGLFAYFIAFRYGLEFLLGLGMDKHIQPTVSVTEYYDLFVDVMLGVGLVFEIPVLIFFLTLIRVVNPAFLVRHSRYAILVIVVLAAIITPTGDVFNLALFATPMILLFYVGIFASYILVLRREKRRFPWGTFFLWIGIAALVLVGLSFVVAKYYGYQIVTHWPYFVR